MHRWPALRMLAHAADRVFRIAVMLASRLSCLLHWGPSPMAAKLVAGHGAGDEREPRPGTPGCRRGSWMGSRMAGMSAGCMQTSGDPGTGDGRQPGIIQLGRPWYVAVEQSYAVSVAGTQEGAAARRIPISPSR